MTLEELEQIAAHLVAYDEWTDRIVALGHYPPDPAPDRPPVWDRYGGSLDDIMWPVARALLAVLPVVRAAEAWRDDVCGPRACQLLDAIDSMRKRLGGG